MWTSTAPLIQPLNAYGNKICVCMCVGGSNDLYKHLSTTSTGGIGAGYQLLIACNNLNINTHWTWHAIPPQASVIYSWENWSIIQLLCPRQHTNWSRNQNYTTCNHKCNHLTNGLHCSTQKTWCLAYPHFHFIHIPYIQYRILLFTLNRHTLHPSSGVLAKFLTSTRNPVVINHYAICL